MAGIKGTARVPAYIASKDAVVGLRRTTAFEGALFNIRMNTVNLASIDTSMMRSLEEGFVPGAGAQAEDKLSAWVPLKCYETSHKIAQLMLFLASDDSRNCTGGVDMRG